MDTFTLMDSIYHDDVAGKRDRFLGVFPRDHLPAGKRFKYPFGLIVNTSKASDDDGGMHWTSVWIADAQHGEFFCSFGKPALVYGLEIHNFIVRATPDSGGIIKENLTQLQHPDSNMCGAFALYFIYHRARGMSLPRIIVSFSYPKHLRSNDVLLKKFLREKVHKCHHPKTCLDEDFLKTPLQTCLEMYKVLYV